MPFSEETKRKGWVRCGGLCECRRKVCEEHHRYRNFEELAPDGTTRHSICGNEAKDAHHIIADAKGGSDDLSNLEYLCAECHKHTESYGVG